MADIGAELLEKIRAEFQSRCRADKYIQSVLKKIDGGTAEMEEVALLSKQLGFRVSQAIGAHVNVAALPGGKMYYNIADTILTGVLKDNYDVINSAAAECQKALDKTAGINITPQQAAFPTERVQAVVNAASVPDIAEEVMIRRMTAPAQNITESFYNDYVQKNVKLRSDAGLDCYIIRNDHGGCCKWCSKLAGKYHYPEDVPKDVYRRHDNCGCTVTYLNGRKAQNVWSKTKWNISDEELEQMKKAGSRQPARMVDNSAKSGIMGVGRKLDRREQNIGAFSELRVPMQKREVLSLCRKYSIDTNGITFKIQRSEKLLALPFYGSTDYNNIGRIDLFPSAFSSEEELLKTILHEKCHVMQLKKYGKNFAQQNLDVMEKQAYRFESIFYNMIKKR
ncbi:hypothetical protein DWX11_12600 [Ruminococcus sp. AF18-29]|jgi:hypothetical protein|nr:hypothetical protein DWX11_12600 [Ruminococcus sp. AF18-29]